jgi:hypothetical protein
MVFGLIVTTLRLSAPLTHMSFIWAPWSWFGILYNQEPVCDPEPLPGLVTFSPR